MRNLQPSSQPDGPPPLISRRKKLANSYLYVGVMAFVGGVVTTFFVQLLIPFTPLLLFGGGITIDSDIDAVTAGQSKTQILTTFGPPDGTLADVLIDSNLRNRYLESYTPATDHHQAQSAGGYNLFWRNQANETAVKVVAFDSDDKVLGVYVLEWARFYKSVNKVSFF